MHAYNFLTLRKGDGPLPIKGDEWGNPGAGLESDFKCAFNANECKMTADGLITDFKWKLGRGNSKNSNTGHQPDSQKPRRPGNGNVSMK